MTSAFEGTLSEQLQGTLAFVRRNMRTKTIIDTVSGNRVDHEEYPIEAVRELVLNALIHRDYSIHTQGMPIQVQMFSDRLVITNPGGLYGRLTVDQLGRVQPDTRNPVIATAMELLKQTENRYSGIPTVRRLVAEAGMPEPEFENRRGEFRVMLRLNAQDHADGRESPQSNCFRRLRSGARAAGRDWTSAGSRVRETRLPSIWAGRQRTRAYAMTPLCTSVGVLIGASTYLDGIRGNPGQAG